MKKILKNLYLKYLYRHCPGYVKIGNITFRLDAGDSLRLWRNRTYSPYVLEKCLEYLPVDGVAIDAGASIGWFACHMAERATTVLAVEPNLDQFRTLHSNLFVYQKARAINYALGAEACMGSLQIDPDNGSGGRMAQHLLDAGKDIQQVPVITLDELLEERLVNNVDLLKMDCEGSEWNVLQGFKRLKDFMPVIVTEINKHAMRALHSSSAEYWHYLHDYGYVYYLDEADEVNYEVVRNELPADGNYLVVPRCR